MCAASSLVLIQVFPLRAFLHTRCDEVHRTMAKTVHLAKIALFILKLKIVLCVKCNESKFSLCQKNLGSVNLPTSSWRASPQAAHCSAPYKWMTAQLPRFWRQRGHGVSRDLGALGDVPLGRRVGENSPPQCLVSLQCTCAAPELFTQPPANSVLLQMASHKVKGCSLSPPTSSSSQSPSAHLCSKGPIFLTLLR